METNLTWEYDKVGDILYISKTPPYAEQDEDELQEGVIARFHPETHEIESLEILFFINRLQRGEPIQLPLEFSRVAVAID